MRIQSYSHKKKKDIRLNLKKHLMNGSGSEQNLIKSLMSKGKL